MTDFLTRLAQAPVGSQLVSRLGLPRPVELDRGPELRRPVLIGGDGRLAVEAARIAGEAAGAEGDPQALVFDATGIEQTTQLRALYDFFHPVIRSLRPCGRVLVLGSSPDSTAQRALEGFVRSLGKEVGRGSTANLIYAAESAPLDSTLRFFLSGRSAYVSGQVVRIEAAEAGGSLDGQVAVVTGAARGIGESIAGVLAREGAHVVCADMPAAGEALADVANRVGGSALQLDVTADDAPERLSGYAMERHGGLDVMVHNAGITRDRTLGRMSEEEWDVLLDVNLSSQERMDHALLGGGALRRGGRIVGVSSIAGIAGNRGQSNYGTSKAGVIGMVGSMTPAMREHGGTINAVAPGFIETAMTARMPFATREAGRRLNSLAQGGLPVDVAETIAWMAAPASRGVNGNVVRVCGQSLIGA